MPARHPPASDTTVDHLSATLASTSLDPHPAPSTQSHEPSFPPDTTLDEQLLILAGVQDYRLSGIPNETFSAAEVQRAGGAVTSQPDFSSTDVVQSTMDSHLAMLDDAQLEELLHASLRIDTTLPSKHTGSGLPSTSTALVPSSQPTQPPITTLPPIPSLAPSTYSLPSLQSWYLHLLQTASSRHSMLHAPLPSDTQELEDLSVFMAQHVTAWIEAGKEVVFSPAAHPCYPAWMPSQERLADVGGGKEGVAGGQVGYGGEDASDGGGDMEIDM